MPNAYGAMLQREVRGRSSPGCSSCPSAPPSPCDPGPPHVLACLARLILRPQPCASAPCQRCARARPTAFAKLPQPPSWLLTSLPCLPAACSPPQGAVGLNAATSQDSTRYFCSLPANKLELWFALEADRFREPVFRELFSEKKVIAEERRLRVEDAPLGRCAHAHAHTHKCTCTHKNAHAHTHAHTHTHTQKVHTYTHTLTHARPSHRAAFGCGRLRP